MATAAPDDALETFHDRVVGRRINEDTFSLYANWVSRFEMWRGGGTPSLGDLIDFDTWLADEDMTDYPWENARGRPAPDEYAYQTRTIALSAVKLWLRVHYDEEIAEDVQDIVSGEPAPFDPTYLTRRDIETVYDVADEACQCPGCEAALRLSYDAIMRASELVLLSREDVNFDAGTVYVTATKGSDNAEVAVKPSTLEAVREYIEAHPDRSEGFLFKNSYGRSWSKESWALHVRRNHHEAGAHSFGRHTPIVHRLEHPEWFGDMREGDAFGQVFQRARHSNPSMTSRYARLVGADIPDWGE
jgi:integrase